VACEAIIDQTLMKMPFSELIFTESLALSVLDQAFESSASYPSLLCLSSYNRYCKIESHNKHCWES